MASPPSKLNTFSGVFTPSILTILGVVLFLRLGYVVGTEGLPNALLIIILANLISVFTTISVAAIATNHKVKSGGVYYLISRSLGVGYGGAIGIVLFLAQSVSVGFYCIGFAEAAAPLFSWTSPIAIPVIAMSAIVVLFGLAWVGADWATRAQYIIMACLALALLSFSVGAFLNAQPANFAENLTDPLAPVPFWVAFAVFFPAVTGFTQGANMSGDLKDANKSIPVGMIAAVAVSIIIYLGFALMLAAAADRQTLVQNLRAMRDIAVSARLIDLGVFAATLSSALASLLGGPRILQALAADDVFPILRPFAEGGAADDTASNPRRALILTGIISLAVVALGNLNAIASIVSMFFVISYGLLNYATFFEARFASASFRPTFRYYHPVLSLIGGFACLIAMVEISLVASLASAGILLLLRTYLERNSVTVSWADGRRAHHLGQAREHLIAAAKIPEHARDWRPQLLVFSDSSRSRVRILRFSDWITGRIGIAMVAHVIEGKGEKALKERVDAENALVAELDALGSAAFPLVTVAPRTNDALGVVIQSAGVGPIRANTVVVNWSPEQPGFFERLFRPGYSENLDAAFRLGRNLILLDADDAEWERLGDVASKDRIIDIWWHEGSSGHFMLLISHLMTRHAEWKQARIRLLLLPEEGKTFSASLDRLRAMLASARIDAELAPASSLTDMTESSARSHLILIPFQIHRGQFLHPLGTDLKTVLNKLPITVLCAAAADVELDIDPDRSPTGPSNPALTDGKDNS